MKQPFAGQYIAWNTLDNGQRLSFMINVDSDKSGEGVAYVTGIPDLGFCACDCEVQIDADGSLHGFARRSEMRERRWSPDRTLTEKDKREVRFSITRSGAQHELTLIENGTESRFTLSPLNVSQRVQPEKLSSWKEFMDWASATKNDSRATIFRGIARSGYSLKTSFHRKGRVDLDRYQGFDLPTFTDLAETIGGLRFEGDTGAIWGFAQHHGFPSPLLDWTASPFIAAYFAFYERLESGGLEDDEPVRIYSLDGDFVSGNQPPSVLMVDAFPRVWIFKPNSKGNQRLVFQQGFFLHSNVIDVEAYLLDLSKNVKRPILKAVEMPSSIAADALDQLSYMGISHLSLFPGLDGAAKHAAFQQFHLRARG